MTTVAYAQTSGTPTPPAPVTFDPDLQFVPAEPDFTLATLPSLLRMPKDRFAFRLTHRFTRAIDQGGVGSFFANFLNMDSSALVGFELRYGVARGTSASVLRTSERTIQFAAEHGLWAQRNPAVSRWTFVAVEGRNNFSEHFTRRPWVRSSRTASATTAPCMPSR